MTNTHINVGGHKITTNKVGQVHTVTLPTGFTGTVQWCVTNGICVVNAVAIRGASTGDNQSVGTVPKPKILDSVSGGIMPNDQGTSITGIMWANYSGTLFFNINVANQNGFATLVYPVADDWVES